MAQQDFTIKGKVGSLNAPAKAYLFPGLDQVKKPLKANKTIVQITKA